MEKPNTQNTTKDLIMRILTKLTAFAFIFALGASCMRAGEPEIGKPPPAVKVDEWISAQPDTTGKPVLVEFWATWCPPCRKSIPHLNELQEKFKNTDLVIIGVSDEDPAKVRDFQKGTPMNYPNGVSKDLVQQYGVTGIPSAFLIDASGNLVWKGHPMTLTEAELQKVVK